MMDICPDFFNRAGGVVTGYQWKMRPEFPRELSRYDERIRGVDARGDDADEDFVFFRFRNQKFLEFLNLWSSIFVSDDRVHRCRARRLSLSAHDCESKP